MPPGCGGARATRCRAVPRDPGSRRSSQSLDRARPGGACSPRASRNQCAADTQERRMRSAVQPAKSTAFLSRVQVFAREAFTGRNQGVTRSAHRADMAWARARGPPRLAAGARRAAKLMAGHSTSPPWIHVFHSQPENPGCAARMRAVNSGAAKPWGQTSAQRPQPRHRAARFSAGRRANSMLAAPGPWPSRADRSSLSRAWARKNLARGDSSSRAVALTSGQACMQRPQRVHSLAKGERAMASVSTPCPGS